MSRVRDLFTCSVVCLTADAMPSITGGSTRPAYRMEGDTLKVDPRQEGDVVVQAFYPVGIAFDLPKGQRAVRVEVGNRAWQCGKE